MNVTFRKNLLRELKRFAADEKRGISLEHFADAAGLSPSTLYLILNDRLPMSAWSQLRLSKALNEWRAGMIKIMQRMDRTKYVDYRAEPQPVARRTMQLQSNGKVVKLRVGLRQRGDYSQPTLAETLDGEHPKR